jgi:hypothetical protein
LRRQSGHTCLQSSMDGSAPASGHDWHSF